MITRNLRGALLFAVMIAWQSGQAQTSHWLPLVRQAAVAAAYGGASPEARWTSLENTAQLEKGPGLVREYSDGRVRVRLTFTVLASHITLSGEIVNSGTDDLCLTVRVSVPLAAGGTWGWDLDSVSSLRPGDVPASNTVECRTIVPPAGAFNADSSSNGGYGDRLGTGRMSFYPVASFESAGTGYGWGIDMGLPIVYRLSCDPSLGAVGEFDLALSADAKKFPNRSFFTMIFFEHDRGTHLRGALEKYYTLQPEYFRKRIPQEGIWLPFAPLHPIRGWQDFGFSFHETNTGSMDRGVQPPATAFQAGRKAGVLAFQYTEPWEEEIPIRDIHQGYDSATGPSTVTPQHAAYMATSAARDKAGRLIARKLETPWFPSGWAVSINTNPDPDIAGFNRYQYVSRQEMLPALGMNADGIYFDCLEWHWQYDLNYNRAHFEWTDFPLTFSSSVSPPRPAIWGYASDLEFVRKVALDLHAQGKYVMGNSFTWLPWAAGQLDVFGSELSWYAPAETGLGRLKFARAMACQKPVVFLLNEGMDDTVFTSAPYRGYQLYFDRMLLYGFFPSFFSVNATSNIYWSDSIRYNQGRPFFKKYIPIIRMIAAAGWQPVTHAAAAPGLAVERFGAAGASPIYFTLYNPGGSAARTKLLIDASALGLGGHTACRELLDDRPVRVVRKGHQVELDIILPPRAARVVRLRAE
jgi:hypothetical protein